MVQTWIGWHQPVNGPSGCKLFDRCLISINRLEKRKPPFPVNDWFLDNGSFSRFLKGKGHISSKKYAKHIHRLNKNPGVLQAAASQDWLCTQKVLDITGLDVPTHQKLCVLRYDSLNRHLKDLFLPEFVELEQDFCEYALDFDVDPDYLPEENIQDYQLGIPYLMPVLQGQTPQDYVAHLHSYGDRIGHKDWVCVGSLVQYSKKPAKIIEILQAIKGDRPDILIHGLGIKLDALRNPVLRELVHSVDSQAHGLALGSGSKKYCRSNDPLVALAYGRAIENNSDFLEELEIVEKNFS